MNDKIIMITAVRGSDKNLRNLIENVLPTMHSYDLWVIVHDNQDAKYTREIESENVVILQNRARMGAGNARNVALEYIRKTIDGPFVLFPVDADDVLVPNTLKIVRSALGKFDEKIISFGHHKIFKSKIVTVGWNGVFTLSDQLRRYRTPCGSTVVKFENVKQLEGIEFGARKRANDQLFFLKVIAKYKFFRCVKEPILEYSVGDSSSVSGKKHKMPLYKYLAMRDFGKSPISAAYYMAYYFCFGILRHVFKLPY